MKNHPDPLRAAIIGAGPSGFFCADYLLRLAKPCTVAMFERMPWPFGLVRDAVAPDKPNIRASTLAFSRIAASNRFSFFGNVAVGRDLSLEELRHAYHAVIVTTGASQPRALGVQGETLPGCVDAVAFAGWYNGRAAGPAQTPRLDAPSVVIIGAGNAALDVARILATPAAALEHTDICGPALRALARSKVTDIHIAVRRGPFDVRFSPQELELLARTEGCGVQVHAEIGELHRHGETPERRRLQRAYLKAADTTPGKRCVHLHFHMVPGAILGRDSVEGVLFDGPDGEQVHIPAGLVVTSIGQQGVPLQGLPFDRHTSLIPGSAGRVRDGGHLVPGVYVAGAAKRGANSIIGANKPDCLETVKAILEDRPQLACPAALDDHAFYMLLKQRGVHVVTWQDWLRIDAAERGRGEAHGKSRERFQSPAEAIAAAFQASGEQGAQ